MSNDITVVLNGYKRSHVFETQLKAVENQTIKPSDIMLWQNYAQDFKNIPSHIKHANNNYNYGVWARFAFALNAKTKYICVFDDDTIPGDMWFENCTNTISKYNGLLGTIGIICNSSKGYIPNIRYGWDNPIDVAKQVDFVGHSWFFEREWLSYFWRELPREGDILVGEDIHFSHMLQKYANKNTYVPPHPKNNKRKWGSLPGSAMAIGTDQAAISININNLQKMYDYFDFSIKNGFKTIN